MAAEALSLGEQRIQESRRIIQLNKFKSLNAPFQSKQIRFNKLGATHIRENDPDRPWKSHATNFARGGIHWQGNSYVRDPRTGVWFKQSASQEFPFLEHGPHLAYSSPQEGPQDASFASTLSSIGSPFLKRTSSAPGSLNSTPTYKKTVSRPDVLPHISVTLTMTRN
eukprot:TRINITY_DN11985_c0_g2_i1.p1 TRINITY_DN11985_c0_g2~~TRINITY_DN11985_c0_g2_i1.p1  ORF type:complete len:167 (-),score=13.38 TRINITY_DN11985_c0_g2_i1:316-816(-)